MSIQDLADSRTQLKATQASAAREQTKKRLLEIIGTKFKTCYVYPLSQMEAAFGELWGHGLEENELTREQRMNRRKWAEVRKSILDCGNIQMRAVTTEMDLHEVRFVGHTISFERKEKE